MPLILAPSYDEQTREQIEAALDAIRARRMLAATEYHSGRNAKLKHESDVIQQRFERHYTVLGKEITRLDKAIEAVEQRLIKIDGLKQEIGLLSEMIVSTE